MSGVLTDEQIDISELIGGFDGRNLVVHNDDVNTFDWVIISLVEICNHTYEQAEQCAYIIHFSGKYAVKHGSDNTLKPMKNALVDRGINATIE